ncbi:peptidyl-prolyl cis-trans isomerase, cyclophilin type [Methanococcus maripaludis C5]|uniref:peptidylprolyl isomerase n=1 Tax=Methanococcus maripaludis (strain C5 / ATCC BAA-1333) TaxID=402880 RepID=A4FX41_METM5|nr:peptidylprolyl isomerase [Methanococcus maripaludis]ABO34770.1 peptidyl-prolyl cis-trans isomerase, cyclophilin type [Methanococcus maripaludis C5]
MIATIQTTLGTIKIELFKEKAPITVENFKKYAETGFYEGTIFHRVIQSFMVQGGGFTKDGVQKETMPEIKNEAKNGLSNKRGTIAMARTNVVDSATSQFFINTVENMFLNYKNDANYGYAVFGEMTEGFEVLDKIAAVKTGNKGYFADWPVEDVIIEKVTIEE